MEFVHPEDQAATLAEIGNLAAGTATVSFENRYLCKDGSFKVLRWTSAPAALNGYLYCTARDVTESTAAERALRESEVMLREAQKIANLGSFDWDIVADKVVFSDEMFRISGIKKSNFAGTFESAVQTILAEDRPRVEQAVQVATTRKQPFEVEYRVQNPGGALATLHARLRVVVDAGGQVVRVVGTVQDISDRKKLDDQVLFAGKMSAVGTLGAGMAHDTGGAFTPRARKFLERVPNPRLQKPFDAQNLCVLVRSLVP